jgi:polyferredoxin
MVTVGQRDPSPRRRRLARWRLPVQAAFLMAWLDPIWPQMHWLCGPVFHCHSCPWALVACPIGVLANFGALHELTFVAAGMLLVWGTILGSFVCGWVCPFGLLQDLAHRIPLPKFQLPAWTGYCRYAVLAVLVVAVPYWYGEGSRLFFCRLCPAGGLEAALPNSLAVALAGKPWEWPSAAKMAILLAVVAAMLFTWRPWCRLFCPLGAIYAVLNRVSLLFLRFHPEQCAGCASCRSLCRAGGRPQERLDGLNCVRCLECVQCQAVSVGTPLR